MKRFLLFACIVAAAMSANAQKLMPVETSSLVFKKQPVKVANIQVNPDIKVKKITAIASNMAKAPAKADIFGSYVEDLINEEGDFHKCSSATLSAVNVKDQETGEVYDVQLTLDNSVISILGQYDPETGTINCGAQTCEGGGDATGLNFDVLGIVDNKLSLELSFTIDDDKTITCDQDGYIMYINDGPYKDYTWDGGHWDPMFYFENGVQAGYLKGRSTNNEWAAYENPIAVDDWGSSVTIYNFCGWSAVSIDINEDGTVSMPTGQNIIDLGFNPTEDAEEIETYGNYLFIYGMYLEGNKIGLDLEKKEVLGTIKGNTITLSEYFRLGSKIAADDSWYAGDIYADGTTFTLSEGMYTAGIQEVTETREEKIKNTKTYNLMGQQVNRATAKGLLIRDGKKYFKK